MRRAFTLIEILVVVAILAIGAAAATFEYVSGREGARLKGAARDIYATMRLARSKALVMREPCIVTYSSTEINGKVSAKVEITSAKVFSDDEDETAMTLTGETVRLDGSEEEPAPARNGKGKVSATKDGKPVILESADAKEGAAAAETPQGETMEDVIFSPIDDAVMEGICIKVQMEGEMTSADGASDDGAAKAKISIFSNADYLIGKLKGTQETESKANESKSKEDETKTAAADASDGDRQERVDVVWGVNGQCTPHQVWVYPVGTKPEEGYLIKVDRFGAPKIVTGEEEE